MPALPGVGNCQYTPISTAGTTTLNPGQASGPPIQPGVLYGMQQLTPGTNFGALFLDIFGTTTNTIITGTGTAGQIFPAGVPGFGVRYRGALVVVTSGTPGALNALWD